MPDSPRRNGPSVEPLLEPVVRPVLREAPRLRPGATEAERAQAYATLAVSADQHTRQVYAELDRITSAINLMPDIVRRSIRETIADERELLREELQRDVERAVAREVEESIPDPDEIEHAAERGARAGVEKTGPQRSLSPTSFEKMTTEKIELATLRQELRAAEARAKAAEEKLAEKSSDKRLDRRDWRTLGFTVAGLVIAALICWASATVYGNMRHDAGVAEGRALEHEPPPAGSAATQATPPGAPAAPPARP